MRQHLTKATDGINTFRGLVSILVESLNSGFFMGIPEAISTIAITWTWFNHRPDRRYNELPSWTWASWMNTEGDPQDSISPYIIQPPS